MDILTIKKIVDGTAGDLGKDFSFTVNIEGAGSGEDFTWAKDGVEQTPMSRTGGIFTLKNDEKVEIAIPVGVTVTVTEVPEEYTSSIKIDDGDYEEVNSKTFTFLSSTTVTVKNKLDMVVPTGIYIGIVTAVVLIIATVGCVIYVRRRRKQKYS